jgi:hypothetical protein
MHVCLDCGQKKRSRKKARYPCPDENCRGSMIKASYRMLSLAHLFRSLGYRIYSATAKSSYLPIDNSNAVTVCVEFAQIYPKEAFPDLPPFMEYKYNEKLFPTRCMIIYYAHLPKSIHNSKRANEREM